MTRNAKYKVSGNPSVHDYLLIALLFLSSAQAGELKPFTSDGCSAFPDGTWEQRTLWLTCCTAHDYAYWKGGTFAQRVEADEQLRSCVAQVGNPDIARLMMMGVRVGGSPFWPTRFRWGYGWPYPRSYGPLTGEERQQLERMLPGKPSQEETQRE